MTDQPPKLKRRRWFQFSLRTLLIAVTLVGGLLVAWRVYVEPYRQQRETMTLIEELGGSYKAESGGPTWMRDWFGGDNFQNIVLVDVADFDDPEKYLEQIASLPSLKTLVVGGRDFTDEHLSRLKRLTTLCGLVLDSTSVTDDGIGALKQTLPALTIYKSQRRSIAVFEQLLPKVKITMYQGWSQPSVDTQLCGTLPQLRQQVGDEYFQDATSIHLWKTQISDVGLVHLKGLRNLKSLDLMGTQVSDAGLAHLEGLSNLQTLYLGWTKISDTGLAHLEGLSNLQTLHLSGTSVSDAGLAHLKVLTNLQWLILERTQVTGHGLAHLKGLSKLQVLSLTDSDISDAGLAHLKVLTTLKGLILSRTQVSDAGLVHLKGLASLRSLYLDRTQVSDAGVEKLQKALPNCDIDY